MQRRGSLGTDDDNGSNHSRSFDGTMSMSSSLASMSSLARRRMIADYTDSVVRFVHNAHQELETLVCSGSVKNMWLLSVFRILGLTVFFAQYFALVVQSIDGSAELVLLWQPYEIPEVSHAILIWTMFVYFCGITAIAWYGIIMEKTHQIKTRRTMAKMYLLYAFHLEVVSNLLFLTVLRYCITPVDQVFATGVTAMEIVESIVSLITFILAVLHAVPGFGVLTAGSFMQLPLPSSIISICYPPYLTNMQFSGAFILLFDGIVAQFAPLWVRKLLMCLFTFMPMATVFRKFPFVMFIWNFIFGSVNGAMFGCAFAALVFGDIIPTSRPVFITLIVVCSCLFAAYVFFMLRTRHKKAMSLVRMMSYHVKSPRESQVSPVHSDADEGNDIEAGHDRRRGGSAAVSSEHVSSDVSADGSDSETHPKRSGQQTVVGQHRHDDMDNSSSISQDIADDTQHGPATDLIERILESVKQTDVFGLAFTLRCLLTSSSAPIDMCKIIQKIISEVLGRKLIIKELEPFVIMLQGSYRYLESTILIAEDGEQKHGESYVTTPRMDHRDYELRLIMQSMQRIAMSRIPLHVRLSCAMLADAASRMKSERESEQIDSLISHPIRLHRMILNNLSKLYLLLLSVQTQGTESAADSGSTGSTLEFDSLYALHLISESSQMRKEARELFQICLREFPQNPRVLRAYARFMGEVENDHEAEYNLLEFADTIEEERSGKRNPVTSLRIKSKQRKQSRQVSTSANAFDSGDENPHVSKDTDEASASNAPSRKNSGVGGAMDVNGLALQEAGQEESEASKTFATYSHRAETHSSAAVDRLVVVVLVCLIIYCVAVIFCFVITEVMLGSGTQSANLINRSGQLRYLSQATFLDTRKISQNLANAAAIADLKTLTAKAVDNYLMVRGSPDTQIPGILEAWQKTYQVRRYQPDTGVQYVETAMYLDFLRAYYMQTATIGDGPAKLSGDAFNVSARYILDNGMGSMLTAAKTFTTDIVAAFLAGNSVFQAALWVEPSLLAIPVILILFIFAPSYRAFRKERHELLAVMAAVPKSIARAVHTTLSMHGKSGNDDGDRLGIRNAGSLNSRSRKSSLKRFTVAFFSLTILVMAIVVIFSVLGSVYVGGFTDQSHEVDFSGERRMLARRISALLGELQSFDPLSWSSYSQVQHSVREALDRLAYLDRALRYGSASLGLPGSDGKNSAIDDAYYLSPCTKDRQVVVPVLALNSSYTCVATASLLESFMASASNILSLSYTDPSLIPSNSLVAITQDLEIRALAPRLHAIVFLYETQRDTQQDIIQAIAITSFTLGFPLGLLLLYLTFKHLQRLREEEREILRVLLCIPVKEIVENDSLRTVFFCDEGRQSAVETAAVEQDVDREKYALLQSAMQDPVIELSYDVRTDTSRVEKMNNKARRLFGRNHSAALGGDFLMLFAQSSHAQIRNTVRDALAASSSVTSGTNLKKQSKASMHGLAKDSGSRLLNGDDQCSAEVEALSDSQTTFPCRITVACAHSKSNVLILLVHDLTQERLRENLLLQEKAQSQSLLENALPKAIALRMRNGEKSIADAHAEVTLFFSDIVGFTSYSSTISATELVTFLNEVTCECDALLDKYHITKIKTIGDALFVATGLPEYRKTHAEDMVGFALEVLEVYRRYNEKHGTSLQIRVGIHTGPVAAGVIGSVRYAYDVWGDSVNLASRMESTGVPGRIQVTRATYEKVYHLWDFEEREVYAKGKGTIQAYVLKDPKHPAPPLAQPSAPPNDNASHSVSVSSSSHGSQPHISVTEIHAPPRSSHARSRMTSGDYGRSTESFDAASLGCGMSDPGPLQS